MPLNPDRPGLVLALATLMTAPAAAQIDYRNLDDDRPTAVEDAYPIERWAFELIAPWRVERISGGSTVNALVPELAYGAFRNMHLGVKLPFASVPDGSGHTSGMAGLRGFALYNFTTETTRLPALSLRADVSFPVGGLAGDGSRFALEALATRSIGRQRVHLNASIGGGADQAGSVVEPIPAWSLGAAVDHTFIRESLLLIGELVMKDAGGGEPSEAVLGVGGRWQFTPTLVLDAGLSRRLTSHGPDFGFTIGLSHAFAIRALMPTPVRQGGAR